MASHPVSAAETSAGEAAILAELRQMLSELYHHDQFAIHDRVVDFHIHLKRRYPDFAMCRLYHLVTWSSLAGEVNRFDFPAEDSIEAFIRSEYHRTFPHKIHVSQPSKAS